MSDRPRYPQSGERTHGTEGRYNQPSTSRHSEQHHRHQHQHHDSDRGHGGYDRGQGGYDRGQGGNDRGGDRRREPTSINYNHHQQEPFKPRGETSRVNEKGPRREKSLTNVVYRTKPEDLQSKQGQSGIEVRLLSNYFRVLKRPNWELYQYHVNFSPAVELRGSKNRLIFEQKSQFGSYVFDGTILVAASKLDKDVNVFRSEDNTIQITVTYTRSVEAAQSQFILNLILRKSMASLDLQLIRRNYFDPKAKIDLRQHRIQLLPGYITSIRQHENDILLCVEITNKVMRSDTVHDIMVECYKENPNTFKNQFQEKVIGMVVFTDYNNKTYRIDDVDFTQNPTSTFQCGDKETSFKDYYSKRYQKTIKDMGQPLLISKGSDRAVRGGQQLILLIPELCKITGLSESMRINHRLMQDIGNYTRPDPNMRIQTLRKFNSRLQGASTANFREWDFEVDTNLVKVTGRCLKNETILFGRNKRIQTGSTDATWIVRSDEMFLSQHLTNWSIIYPKNFDSNVHNFLRELKAVAGGMNYTIKEPIKESLNDEHNCNYADALSQLRMRNPQLIMVIVSNKRKDKYSLVKTLCCVDYGIPTQVIATKTLIANGLKSIATKVVIQINSKLGGVPWMVHIPSKGVMVIGFAICHDTAKKGKSFSAMVATMDMQRSQNYYVRVNEHKDGEKFSNFFGMNVTNAITAYKKQHYGALPAQIIIYRDGVGDGQIQYVKHQEIEDIRSTLKRIYNEQPFRLGFAIVSKKINTRFFAEDRRHRGSFANPSPGTVVDDVVTLRERYDFFLVSQYVRRGTVSPTSYNILYNNTKFTPEQWQTFTYKMTHLYYNWTGTVSVPAVCHYAHKLAFLVANFIHQTPNDQLAKQLYFI